MSERIYCPTCDGTGVESYHGEDIDGNERTCTMCGGKKWTIAKIYPGELEPG